MGSYENSIQFVWSMATFQIALKIPRLKDKARENVHMVFGDAEKYQQIMTRQL